MSFDTMLKLAELARAAEACSPRINTPDKLAARITRVLVVSVAKQSRHFNGTADEAARIEMLAMEEYNYNPQFRHFIDAQVKEIMLLVGRYDPR
jgi:hypothetical protein